MVHEEFMNHKNMDAAGSTQQNLLSDQNDLKEAMISDYYLDRKSLAMAALTACTNAESDSLTCRKHSSLSFSG